ncbi:MULTISPECIES: hypothetical protein [Polaromonas]|uniref:Uncharacterized protein n=1 Tax=Polaromonas aquatica TaxID=332657 RepID=A0ABW1TXV0_9BURK
MTLIVARVIGEKILILGDTALSYQTHLNSNAFIEGCLKQYRVNDHLAVAFAGDSSSFELLCAEFLSCDYGHQVIEVALQNPTHLANLDLLIAEVGGNEITFIKKGVVTSAAAGFIGDALAYDKFQLAYHGGPDSTSAQENAIHAAHLQVLRIPEPIDEGDPYIRIFDALKAVVNDPDVPSVGGVIVPLCTDRGEFRYINYMGSSMFHPVTANGGSHAMEFGTVQAGGYSFDFSDDKGRGGRGNEIGFYLLQAGFGVIFPADSSGFRRADLLRASTPTHWVLNTMKRFGHGFDSTYINPVECGIVGQSFLKEENFDDALFCFGLGNIVLLEKENPHIMDRYQASHAVALLYTGQQNKAIGLLEAEIAKDRPAPVCSEVRQQIREDFGV